MSSMISVLKKDNMCEAYQSKTNEVYMRCGVCSMVFKNWNLFIQHKCLSADQVQGHADVLWAQEATLDDTNQDGSATLEGTSGPDDAEADLHTVWSDQAIKLLISLYEERKDAFLMPKVKKKTIWAEIGLEMTKHNQFYTAERIKRKWRHLVQLYTTAKEKNNQTGLKRKNFPYMELMENILGDKADAKPKFIDVILAHKITLENTNQVAILTQEGTSGNKDDCATPQGTSGLDDAEPDLQTVWSDQDIKLLISLYEERKDAFLNPDVKKKTIWAKIGLEMTKHNLPYTVDQIIGKWKHLVRRYRIIRDQKKRTGHSKINFPYMELMENILDDETDSKPKFIDVILAQETTLDDTNQDVSATQEGTSENEDDRATQALLATSGLDDAEADLWNDQAIRLLISLYVERKDVFQNPNVKKKTIWAEIELEMKEHDMFYTYDQIVGKWKHLVRRYRIAKDQNNQTGRKRKIFPYTDLLENIISDKPDAKPKYLVSSLDSSEVCTCPPGSCGCPSEACAGPQAEGQQPKRKRRRQTPKMQMLGFIKDYTKEVQERHEKELELLDMHHKERMEVLKSLVDMLKK